MKKQVVFTEDEYEALCSLVKNARIDCGYMKESPAAFQVKEKLRRIEEILKGDANDKNTY